jgi:CPA1 family monovalent cation:H+ antiporter
MMNAILFLLIGLQLLIIPVRDIQNYWGLGVLCILIVLIARFFSIWLPTKFFHIKDIFTRKTTAILVWGGLRGGVSVALVLSLQAPLNKNLMLVCTFFVVVFSIFVQGMTISKIAKKVV